MTPQDHKRVKHLLNLADAASDFEFVDPKLVNHFHALREDMGLAKLLMTIKTYVEITSQGRLITETSQVSEQNQDQAAM